MEEGDIALAVRDLRRQVREAQSTLHDAQLALSARKTDTAVAAQEEQLIFQHLSAARELSTADVNDALRNAPRELSEAIIQVLRVRRDEDELSLKNLHEEALKVELEVEKVTTMLRAQRAETLRSIKVMAAEYYHVERDAARQLAEISSKHSERQDLAARTEATCLKHARDLFKL